MEYPTKLMSGTILIKMRWTTLETTQLQKESVTVFMMMTMRKKIHLIVFGVVISIMTILGSVGQMTMTTMMVLLAKWRKKMTTWMTRMMMTWMRKMSTKKKMKKKKNMKMIC
uniref:Uncharacterized protein n=1 Tax=Romanomermis culicivorax TaxID=13658 RepID=A0A915IT39_ROMCU